MTKRVLTGAAFAVLVLLGIYFQGWVMRLLLSFAMVVSTYEIYHAIRATGTEPVRWVGYVFCGLAIAAQLATSYTTEALQFSMIALLLSVVLTMTVLVVRGKVVMECMTATLFPMLYPGIFYMVLLSFLDMDNRAVVTAALTVTFFSASVNDVFALFTGMLLGRHKLAPSISPKKTVEGSIGGIVASVLFTMALPSLLRLIFARDPAFLAELDVLPPAFSFALLGLVGGALSQIGDLTASMIKRHCGIKDFGKMLPGHGGIMDRMDGILFCGAACYIFFRLAGLG